MGNLFSISISFDNLLSRCSDCIARHPNHVLQLQKNLDLLRNDWDELKTRRDGIKRRIDVEEHDPQMKRHEVVEWWLLRVEAKEADVEKVMRDGSQEILHKRLGGCCPKNCKTSYKLGKQVAKLQQEVADLKAKGQFEVVTSKTPLALINEVLPATPTLGLNSMLNKVWSIIEDDQAGMMIGLYGMGGVGKTTLLIEVNNKLCSSPHGFNVIIFITVSKNPDLRKVQDEIGEQIGIKDNVWKTISQEKKAKYILSFLRKKKFVLLLDDLWERLDLTKIGIPLQNQIENMSKIVFATRMEDVCGQMEVRKKIKMECLAEEEAWNLFKEKVGDTLNAHPEIPELARVVAKECDGLPLALVTVGRTLASRTTPQEWHHAIQQLQRSGMEDKVLHHLKLSYDSLPSVAVKSCFLYCSLYPEDSLISREGLRDCWISEGFLNEFDEIYGARNQGHDIIIAILVRANLLEEISPKAIKMHDVIRDMAIWIACEGGAMKDKFFVQARAGLTEAPELAKWKGIEKMSLAYNKVVKLTGTPECTNLLTLFLNNNNLKMITSGFFHSMPNLRVLDLSGNTNLTRFPIEICELVSLQYLNLSNTGIEKLPIKLHTLVNLKYLNLAYTAIHNIPEGLLSNFTKLQVLKLVGCGLDNLWDGPSTTIVKELERLEYLNDLTITIKGNFALSNFLFSNKLMSITTTLGLAQFNGSRNIDLLFLKEMIRLKRLEIIYCEILEDFTTGKGKVSSMIINHNWFHNLCSLWISDCPRLNKDLTWLTFAPNLEDIYISDCYGMNALVGGWIWDEDTDGDQEGGSPIPFSKLKVLHLQRLPQLERICQIALPFPRLKDMTVHDGCQNLKKLPFNSNSYRGSGISIWGEENWWNGLEWEDEATRLAFLPSFKPISSISFVDL